MSLAAAKSASSNGNVEPVPASEPSPRDGTVVGGPAMVVEAFDESELPPEQAANTPSAAIRGNAKDKRGRITH
jgi:hypothetical protein